jgi:hypothetical protein
MIRTARHVQVGQEIAKLRKDWLNLAKSTKRVQSLQDIEDLRRGAARWATHLAGLWQQIKSELRGRKRDPKMQANEGWLNQYLENQGPLWKFNWELRNMPSYGAYSFRNHDEIRKNLRETGRYGEEEIEDYIRYKVPTEEEQEKEAIQLWQGKARLWNQRGKKKAVAAWKWLKEYADWTASEGWYGGGGEAAEFNIAEKENQVIEGFNTQMIGFDERSESHWSQLARLRKGLRFYRQRAKLYYPWILQNQLPFEMYFAGGPGTNGSEAAATYDRTHIRLGFWAISSEEPRSIAKILAHEMGHHAWQAYLSGASKTFWDQSIKGDWGELDLREVLAKMKPNETLGRFGYRIEREYPVMHLQLESLLHDPRYSSLDLYSLHQIKEALDDGELNPVVRAPKNPITGYASKNTEEAFCETLGLLVGFGPRALLPDVKKRFRALLPNVKLSSARKVAGSWVAKQAVVDQNG